MQTYFFPNMGFYTQHLDDAHVFIPKDFWPKMPSFEDDSDEADAIKRMFKLIVQVGVGRQVWRGDSAGRHQAPAPSACHGPTNALQ